ncbi:MAG: SDR family NAD(P)-dependent oxidoreductase, partial [Actinomycetota bacterium]
MANTSEQTIVITGATAGLGRRLSERLGAEGARVVVHGRSPERVEHVVDEIRGAGGNADGAVADLASLAEVDRLAGEVRRRYDRLDVLVNNAG